MKWSSHWRGHLLLFDRERRPEISANVGIRLLLAAVVLEVARIAAVRWLHPGVPLWILLPALLGVALWAVPRIGGVTLREIGLRPWREWTDTEKSYFIQVLVIANVIFPLVLAQRIGRNVETAGLASSLWRVFVPYLFYGFYQELVYRGMIQSELVRRTGAAIGIVAADVLYTFGPLHWNYFASPASFAVPMFARIFAIGLFFGILYRRSGNLWLVAIFHAVGNAYIVWSAGSAP